MHEPWANVEVREYTFAEDESGEKGDDEDEAWLVAVGKPQPVVKEGEAEPTSSE